MSDQERRFWPYRPRTSVLSAILILVGLLIIVAVSRVTLKWPSADSEAAVLIGVLLFSLLPILLALVDVIIERGGVFEYGGLKIDFSQVRQMGISGITVPVNIGVRGEPVNDSTTTKILDALKQATACDSVIIDLEEGQAWWETRLLVLLAGAVRLKKPQKVVFVGKDSGKDSAFQGWSHPYELLPHLLRTHPQYSLSYHSAMAAARRWELVKPTGDAATPPQLPFFQETVSKNQFQNNDLVSRLINKQIIKNVSYDFNLVRFDDSIEDEDQLRKRLELISGIEIEPIITIWQQSSQAGLGAQHPWMAFDDTTRLPNNVFAEQSLASDLGEKVESKEGPRTISLVRLNDIFQPVLYKTAIDTSWPTERQITEFFDSDIDYLAFTQEGKYLSLTSRLSVLNAIVRTVVEKKQAR